MQQYEVTVKSGIRLFTIKERFFTTHYDVSLKVFFSANVIFIKKNFSANTMQHLVWEFIVDKATAGISE
jgi:hypothetical protein